MNKERLKRVRDLIKDSQGFNMATWGIDFPSDVEKMGDNFCNTAACIGGHALADMYAEGYHIPTVAGPSNRVDVMDVAQEWLGLTRGDANALFTPEMDEDGIDIDTITQEHAVRCLDNFIKTGVVDWVATKFSNL